MSVRRLTALHGRAKYFFAALAAIIAGGFLLIDPPDDLRAEIPAHVEIGVAFAGYGVLALVAMVSTIARRLLGVLTFGGIAGALAYVCLTTPFQAWEAWHFVVALASIGSAGIALLFLFIGPDWTGEGTGRDDA